MKRPILEGMTTSTRRPLVPGTPTPIRSVPESIERPEYAWRDTVNEANGEPWVQTPEVIESYGWPAASRPMPSCSPVRRSRRV